MSDPLDLGELDLAPMQLDEPDEPLEEVQEPPPAPKVSRKRSRPEKKKAPLTGPGVVVLGNRFACSYSGRVVERGVFIPGIDTAVFANFPCAFAWLERESGATKETIADLKLKMADAYEQSLETVEVAPARTLLADFGGDQFYHEWMGKLIFWDRLTEAKGVSPDEWKQRNTGNAVRGGRRNAQRVTFDADMYSIAYGKGPAGCKKINTLDSDEEPTHAKPLTVVKAYRKVQTFINTHTVDKVATFERSYFNCPNYFLVALTPTTVIDESDTKLVNNIATQLAGRTVYGPAIAIFTRKHVQKI